MFDGITLGYHELAGNRVKYETYLMSHSQMVAISDITQYYMVCVLYMGWKYL